LLPWWQPGGVEALTSGVVKSYRAVWPIRDMDDDDHRMPCFCMLSQELNVLLLLLGEIAVAMECMHFDRLPCMYVRPEISSEAGWAAKVPSREDAISPCARSFKCCGCSHQTWLNPSMPQISAQQKRKSTSPKEPPLFHILDTRPRQIPPAHMPDFLRLRSRSRPSDPTVIRVSRSSAPRPRRQEIILVRGGRALMKLDTFCYQLTCSIRLPGRLRPAPSGHHPECL